MKYNPKFCDAIAGDPGLNAVHPGAPASLSQGWLEILVTLEEKLCAVTGMARPRCSRRPVPRASSRGCCSCAPTTRRTATTGAGCIIPDSAHGTNPASVTLGGYEVTTVPSNDRGLVDLDALRAALGPDVAGIMLTNPNTRRSLRRGDRRDRQGRARRRRAAVLRRREPERHPGRGASRRHGL